MKGPAAGEIQVDRDYLVGCLLRLLDIPSPSGYTDNVVRHTVAELEEMGLSAELTRRGAIRVTLPGRVGAPDRAVVAHLDTTGAMVRAIKSSGRLALAPIGSWSSRFAEGARTTVYTDVGYHRGTILPLKSSGHAYGAEVDTQPVGWDHVELRLDELASSGEAVRRLGVNVGDYVAVDAAPEITPTSFVVSRHLDNKAGVAATLAAARALVQAGAEPVLDCHLLFTIFEEVGSGASAVLHGDVAEMVGVDGAVVADGNNSLEREVSVGLMDSSGPFDYHLSHRLIGLARDAAVPMRRDLFRHYRCDAASAVEAGNDIRAALLCYGLDGSHGYERTHVDGLCHLAQLIALYALSEPTSERDEMDLSPIEGFTEQPT